MRDRLHFGHISPGLAIDETPTPCCTQSQHRTNDARKVEADVVSHLHLVDARQIIFNRIFGRDDFCVGPIEFIERGVERRGFPRSGWTGHENDAVGAAD